MPNFDVNNFVIDRVIRGLMISPTDGSVMWSINQIADPDLSITSETEEKTDAIGTLIASFNRGKKAEFSANNTVFDLGLYAAQNGVEKEIATETETILSPAFETITVPTDVSTAVKLAHKPNTTPTAIYMLKGDGTMGEKLVYNATAGTGKFTYNDSEGSITFPSEAVAGTQYFIVYEYAATSAVAVTGDAVNFPKNGKFIMEVLGTDVCDTSTLIHAYVVFANSKLDANVDVTFTTEGNHPFKIIAQQAYCDKKKRLFQIIIPDEE